jgi:catechol 2,3-dioxygenase-like lactoylglutathione lyase family enzyme
VEINNQHERRSPRQERNPILIKQLSRLAIGVRDLNRESDFYANACGLKIVDRASGRVCFRGADGPYYALELIADRHRLCRGAFEVSDNELDRAARILRGRGLQIELGPDRGVEPGVGRLLRFRDPEGNSIELVSDVEGVEAHGGPKRPKSLNHVLLCAADLNEQQNFFVNALGMRVSDTVAGLMTFLRCNANHHSSGFIALPRRGLHHAAFDLAHSADLSEVIVRLGDLGVRRVDGPGRHGPGNMLCVYFEDPESNLLEWVDRNSTDRRKLASTRPGTRKAR